MHLLRACFCIEHFRHFGDALVAMGALGGFENELRKSRKIGEKTGLGERVFAIADAGFQCA